MTTPRDLDRETSNTADHQYAYDFDFDVMHPLMVRSFQPFFRPGRLLELGSFRGDFTRLLLLRGGFRRGGRGGSIPSR